MALVDAEGPRQAEGQLRARRLHDPADLHRPALLRDELRHTAQEANGAGAASRGWKTSGDVRLVPGSRDPDNFFLTGITYSFSSGVGMQDFGQNCMVGLWTRVTQLTGKTLQVVCCQADLNMRETGGDWGGVIIFVQPPMEVEPE